MKILNKKQLQYKNEKKRTLQVEGLENLRKIQGTVKKYKVGLPCKLVIRRMINLSKLAIVKQKEKNKNGNTK